MEHILMLVLLCGILYLIKKAQAREEQKRLEKGLPPRRKTSPVVWLVFLAMLGGGGFVIVRDLVRWKAKDKLAAADNTAHQVYKLVRMYQEEYEEHGWEQPVTYIGEFDVAEDDFSACIHEHMDDGYAKGCWYAVVFEDGELQYVLFCGHPLSADDLHEPDYDTEYQKLLRINADYRDAIGCYPKEEDR